jgi:spore coat protein U-like protein
MNRNRLLVAAVLLCAAAFVPAAAQAQTATATLTVNASVARNCTIAAATLAFGAYDPIVANAAANLDGSVTYNIACTRGGAGTVWIGMNLGANPTGSTRRMLAGPTEYLNYELFSDATRTTVWANTQATGLVVVPNGRTPVPVTVYGRVPAAQDAAVGSYTDSVTMTINF